MVRADGYAAGAIPSFGWNIRSHRYELHPAAAFTMQCNDISTKEAGNDEQGILSLSVTDFDACQVKQDKC
jgi:hypothetical protein